MLSKKHRLSSAEVREVLSLGKGLRGSIVSLKYVVNKGPFKAAAVVSKSVAKKAVDRNRARRALYDALSSLLPADARPLSNIRAVFFVRSLPSPLAPALREDISGIVHKIKSS